MPEVGGAVGLPLFGRELESKLLADLVSGIRDRGGALFLSGEAGIGKSALLAVGGALAAAGGLRVIRTTGPRPNSTSRSPGCTRSFTRSARVSTPCPVPSATRSKARWVSPTAPLRTSTWSGWRS